MAKELISFRADPEVREEIEKRVRPEQNQNFSWVCEQLMKKALGLDKKRKNERAESRAA